MPHTPCRRPAPGLDLALADARVLAEVLERAIVGRDRSALDTYTSRALSRVWRVQYFSHWMTTLLHAIPDASDFDRQRQLAELTAIVDSPHGSRFLAESYTGRPAT